MKITEQLYDRILGTCRRGGFLGLGWGVTDSTGNPTPDAPLKPGMFVGAENYYGYVVLHVNADMSLTECEKEDEE